MELIKSFFRTNIDSIVDDINKKVNKLRQLAAKHHNKHLEHTETALKASESASEEAANRDRANRIANKFSDLIV